MSERNKGSNIREIARMGMRSLLEADSVKASVADYLKGTEMLMEMEPPAATTAEWLPPDWD